MARPCSCVGSRTLELDSVVTSFEREHFSADYMKKTTHAERAGLLARIRAMAAQAGEVRAQEDDQASTFTWTTTRSFFH